MKTSITTLLFFLSIFLNAQTFEINGNIASFNQNDNSIVVYLFESANKTLVKINKPTANGTFNFKEIVAGIYFVKILGNEINDFESLKFEITNQNLVLEPLNLVKKEIQLNEVVITKKKPIVEVFADKTVFNVQNTLSAIGNSAFELLQKAPGIIVTNSDQIIVEGKTGVQIFIDGKSSVLSGADLTNYLKTIQSSDVDLIEIITNPSSKYDAAGNGGIVNIKLKKDKRFGTNGSLSTGYAIGKFARYSSSLSLNNKSKKTNLFGTYNTNFDTNFYFINLNRTQSNTNFDYKNEIISQQKVNNVKVGLDYFLNKKNTFGVVVNSNFNNTISDGKARTPITLIGNTFPSQVLVSQSDTKVKTYNIATNFNYKFTDTLGHTLTADFDFGKYKNEATIYQPNSYFNGNETQIQSQLNYFINAPIDISIFSFKTDYEQNLCNGKLAIGLKTSVVKTNNVFDFFDETNNQKVLNSTRSNIFNYQENINAFYFNYAKTFKKINYQVGLRAEQTLSQGDLISNQANADNSVKRNYTNYFPSFGLTFNSNINNSWAINYSKRIQRPNYRSLNPFENQTDELSYSKGNPFLQPQYTNNFKITNTYKYTLTTSLSYSFIKDFFAEVTGAESINRSVITTKNVANQEVYNLGVSYAFSFAKWWEVYSNLEFSNSSYKGNDANFVSITQNNFNCYTANTFSLPNKIKIEVSGWFSSPSVWGGTYRTKSLGSLDLAIQKKVFKDKLNVRMAVSDLFYTSNWQGDTQFGAVYINANGGYDSRQFKINLSYNFGNSEVKTTKKKTGIEDENKRI